MDLTQLDLVASTGCVISVAHKAAMMSSLPLLKKNYKFSGVMFFGKLSGKISDYLIAVGAEESMSEKKFFFCQDGVSWAQLPAVTEATKVNCTKLPAGLMLTGDAAHEFPLPEEPLPEGEEPPEEPPEPAKVIELDLLAYLVGMIDTECAIVPKGALCMAPTGAVKGNALFAGLSTPDASSLASYVFANKPLPKNVLAGSAANSMDFLMPATSITPTGALCPHLDEATGVTTIRSLLWPGSVAYAKAGSKEFGYCYFGTGQKNGDIAFMLP